MMMKPFDRGINELQAIRTELVRNLATVLGVALSPDEQELMRRFDTRKADAYDLLLRGRHGLMAGSRDGLDAAVKAFSKEIEVDPQFALAYEGLAVAHLRIADSPPPLGGPLDMPMAAAQQAVARAVDLDPNYADGRARLASILAWMGQPEDALIHAQAAIRLNPKPPAWYMFGLGHAYCLMHNYESVAKAFQCGLTANPEWLPNRYFLAASYAQPGLRDKAVFELARSEVRPYQASVAKGESMPYKNGDDLVHWVDAFKKASGT
ncbi:MAG: hypothetical protein EXQ85_01250 [Alphaproteobacteria bacterium]|nr:hypothetical protein [Alphaproteobacteria bacterium]